MTDTSTYAWDRLGDQIMDTRDLIIVADEIRAALGPDETFDDHALPVDEDEAREILAAIDEVEQAGLSDWQYGETLIRDDYFQDYAEELAADIGAIDPDASWPLNRIDWEAAANDLKIDYTEVEYRGTTYFARA